MSDDWNFDDDDTEELLLRYERSIKENRSTYFDAEEFEAIINHYLFTGNDEAAQRAVNVGKMLHPANPTLLFLQARLYFSNQNYLQSLEVLMNLRKLEYDSDYALLQGECLLRLGRNNEALRVLHEAIDLEKEDKNTVAANAANVLFMNQLTDEALCILNAAYQRDPCHFDVLMDLSLIYRATGRIDDAIKVLNEILDISPYQSLEWMKLGDVLMLKNDYNGAIRAYDFAAAVDENMHDAWIEKGHALYMCEKYEQAIETYKEVEDVFFDQVHVKLLIAECYERLDKFQIAEVYYRHAYLLDGESVDACSGIAICLMEQEQFSEALKYLKRALKLCPDDADMLVYAAECYVNLNMLDEAIRAYQESLQINNNQPDALVSLGSLYLDANNPEKALQYFLEAEFQDANIGGLSVFLTVTYALLNQFGYARYYYQKSQEFEAESMAEIVRTFENEIDWNKIIFHD